MSNDEMTLGQKCIRALKWMLGTNEGMVTSFFLMFLAIIGFLSTFSEPLQIMLGKPLLPIHLEESEKAGRVVMLYHALGVPFLATVVLFSMKYFPLREKFVPHVRWTLYPGSVLVAITGITFAYILQHNWVIHGLFLLGMSMVFYSGILLLIAAWPTKSFPADDGRGVPKIFGSDLEQFNFVLVVFALLVSSVIGAWAGAHFGNGFEAELAEATVREEHDMLQRMVVAHLHIMIALLDAAVMLLIFRVLRPEGRYFNIAMWSAVPGTSIMSIGAWLVITGWEKAHMVINVGAMFLLLSAMILTLLGWGWMMRKALGDKYESTGWGGRIKTLFKDPIWFGIFFQFIFVNIVVTAPGVFTAINLETMRSEAYTEIEYAFNVGHWHVLGTLTAMIVLMLLIDVLGVKGKARNWMGWPIVLGSAFSFIFANFYYLRDYTTPESTYKMFFILTDVGLTIIFIGIFALFGFLALDFWNGKRVCCEEIEEE